MKAWTALLLPLLAAANPLATTSQAADSKIAKNVLESKGEGYCSPSGPIENTLCAYETIEELNKELYPLLHSVVESNFFRHWKVDLFRECPFWYENGFCMNRDCGVETADESHIPEKWRTAALSSLSLPDTLSTPNCDLNSQSFCYIDSESPDSEGQYIDLLLNPERFTGYAGSSAHKVWAAIYEENCFGLNEGFSLGLANAEPSAGNAASLGITTNNNRDGQLTGLSVRRTHHGLGRGTVAQPKEEACLEKRIYYRIISGLHASISIHICADYLDQSTGEWAPNLPCFISRVATHPERLSNVYFDAVVLLRAIARAAPFLEAYDIETAKGEADIEGKQADSVLKSQMERVLSLAKQSGASAFDEKALFQGEDALELRDQFKHNFRNVSRILDCTGCDKCRLWGKLQISGIGTALKILFELDDKAFDPKRNPNLLQRSEIVALINTMHRISESLHAVETFRKMYAETQRIEMERLKEPRPAGGDVASKKSPIKPLKRKPRGSKGSTVTPSHGTTYSVTSSWAVRLGTSLATIRDSCWHSVGKCLDMVAQTWRRLVNATGPKGGEYGGRGGGGGGGCHGGEL